MSDKKYGFMDNGLLLTIIDNHHQALFAIQKPLLSGVQYLRKDKKVLFCQPCNVTTLYEAKTPEDAQLILDTLLRGLVSMTRFRRITLGLCLWVFIFSVVQVSPLFSLTSVYHWLSFSGLMFSVTALFLFWLTHFEKSYRLKKLSVYGTNSGQRG